MEPSGGNGFPGGYSGGKKAKKDPPAAAWAWVAACTTVVIESESGWVAGGLDWGELEVLEHVKEEGFTEGPWGVVRFPLSDAVDLVCGGLEDLGGGGGRRRLVAVENPSVAGVPEEVGDDGGKEPP